METKENRKARMRADIARVNARIREESTEVNDRILEDNTKVNACSQGKKKKITRIRTAGVKITEIDYVETYRRIAIICESRNGECLNKEEYNGYAFNLKWKCGACDHTWKASLNNVWHKHSWCSNCIGNNGETRCRAILEGLYTGYKFISTRPKWLRYIRGRNLELDCYCEDLTLALEYHGIQHYKAGVFHNNTEKDLKDQQERDEFTRAGCIKQGVKLVEVPYTLRHLSNKALKKHIYDETYPYLYDLVDDIEVDIEFLNSEFLDLEVYNSDIGDVKKAQFLKVATPAGYSLSDVDVVITSIKQKFNVSCPIGHVFVTYIDNFVHRGRKCPLCSRTKPVTLDIINDVLVDYNTIAAALKHNIDDNKSRIIVTLNCGYCKEECNVEYSNMKRSVKNKYRLCFNKECYIQSICGGLSRLPVGFLD